jgi:hypothetical protein
MMKLKHIRKIPKKFLAVGFSLNALRSAPSLMALLANFVFAMPLANLLIMFNKQNPSEKHSWKLIHAVYIYHQNEKGKPDEMDLPY